jgi:hypothetical protein
LIFSIVRRSERKTSIADLIVISLLSNFPSQHYSTTVIALNITACIASILGIVTVYRYGFHGIHGHSLLFLTLGIIAWFLGDLTLAYGHFVLHYEEEQSLAVSFADLYWIIGYVFLSLHLFATLKLIHRTQIHTLSIVIAIIVSGSSITYSIIFSSEFLAAGEGRLVGETQTDFIDLALPILYPVLDLLLIIPSIIILTAHRKDYYNFIPWILSSLSLLTNAIADNGFVNHFVHGSTKEMWIWDLFFMTEYIILAGAFYWYNRFHNTIRMQS